MSRGRLLEEVQKRSLSFLTFFSAVLVAFAIILSSFKSRETACQQRAHDIWFPILIVPSVPQQTLFDTILASFGERQLNVRLHVKNETSHSGTVSMLDTSDKVIAAQTLRFVQQVTKDEAVLHLREYTTGLCASPFQLDEVLETNYNVDRETYLWTTVATKDSNGASLFFRQSTVRTEASQAVDSFASFQSRFPAFRSISSSSTNGGALEGTALKFRTYSASPLIGPWGGDTSVYLLVEGWRSASGEFLFWKLILKTSKVSEMHILETAYKGLLRDFGAASLILRDHRLYDDYAQY